MVDFRRPKQFPRSSQSCDLAEYRAHINDQVRANQTERRKIMENYYSQDQIVKYKVEVGLTVS